MTNISLDIISTVRQFIDMQYVGKYVLIRTYASGVHFGKLKLYEPDSSHCILENARRLYSWVDRLTLTEVAQFGVTEDAKMSTYADNIMIGDVIEILLPSQESVISLATFDHCK
jgi:hypothetical protein